MSRKQKRMGPVGCFGQIENIKRQSLLYWLMRLMLLVQGGMTRCVEKLLTSLRSPSMR